MLLSTREDEPFLVLNGIQTQSARTLNLISELDELRRLQVDVLRISPQSSRTDTVIRLFHDCLRGTCSTDAAATELARLMPVGPCDGYWHGSAGMNSRHPGATQDSPA
jgi:collagenase-like PrtC family protease